MSQSPCYTVQHNNNKKKHEKYSLYVHQKMSNVTPNIHDFWPPTMDITRDLKTNSNIKSSFMHNLLHFIVIFCYCL